MLPVECVPEGTKFGAKCHIVSRRAVQRGAWPLINWLIRMRERPVVRDPEIGEQEKGNRDITVCVGQVGKVQSDVVDASQKRNFVARLLAVVAENRANFVASRR